MKNYIPFIFLFVILTENKFLNEKRKYFINLDSSLEEQYSILNYRSEDIKKLSNLIIETLKEIPDFFSKIDQNYEKIQKNQNQEWLASIRAISRITGIDEKTMIITNFFYEVICTSAIITKENGELFMARNNDIVQNVSSEILKLIKDLSFEAYFYKNDNLLFTAQGILGYVGLFNGVREGKYLISVNKRYFNKNREDQMNNLFEGKLDSIFLLNQILSRTDNYKEAVELASSTPIGSGVYYIIAGISKNEGVIITRNTENTDNIDSLDIDNGKWYIVQTNSERDEYCERRDFVEKTLESFLENKIEINYENVMNKILSVPPSKMVNTIYSTVQSTYNGSYFNSKYW